MQIVTKLQEDIDKDMIAFGEFLRENYTASLNHNGLWLLRLHKIKSELPDEVTTEEIYDYWLITQ